MLMDAFKPSAGGTILVSVTGSNITTALAGNGEFVVVTNTSATLTMYVEFGGPGVSASIPVAAGAAGSFALPPGAIRVFRRRGGSDPSDPNPGQPDTHIALIGSAAGPTSVYASCGVGGV